MRLRLTLPCVAAALAMGCSVARPTDPATVSSSQAAYLAIGTEPFWSLEITPGQLNFNGADLPRLAIANPGQRDSGGVRTIRTSRITVTLRAEPCSDGMSDQSYADTVIVTLAGRTLTGCGGPATPRPAASLEQSGWRITAINGQPAVVGVDADLDFANGQVNGSGGCNRLNGAFTQERNRLSFGALTTTRMACVGPQGEQERRVLAILAQPLTIRFGERMTMTWTAPDGSSIALRRLDWD
jgi:heat shock protein HslJ